MNDLMKSENYINIFILLTLNIFDSHNNNDKEDDIEESLYLNDNNESIQ